MILEYIDECLPKTEIAKKFGIPKTISFIILMNRDFIFNTLPDRLQIRERKFSLLEKGILNWLKCMHVKHAPIDGNDLKEKATEFFKNFT